MLRRHSALALFFVTLALCGLGLMVLASAAYCSREPGDDSFLFLRRQAVWLGIGLAACVALALVDYHVWGRFVWWILGGAALLQALCYVPGIGVTINGATRWIGAGGARIQPSEFVKVAVILFLAFWYGSRPQAARRVWSGFLLPGLLVGAVVGMILIERVAPRPAIKDLGTSVVMGVLVAGMWFVAGVPWRHLLAALVLAGVGVGAVVTHDEERVRRLLAYWEGGGAAGEAKAAEQKGGEGYQQWQSLIALGSGGVIGQGMGESRQKWQYLPYAHTDFIFAIIGEEGGLRTTLAVVFGFLLFVLLGGYIAAMAPDLAGTLIASGTVILIGFQAGVNMGVVTDLLPNKGLALPFISSGGSNLVACLALTGLLVSVARHSDGMAAEPVVLAMGRSGA